MAADLQPVVILAEVVGVVDHPRGEPQHLALEGADQVDRAALLETFRAYLEANDMEADWDSVRRADNDILVNALSMMSPYGPAEKQALLEAPDLKSRAETLIAITEMELARDKDDFAKTLQ